MLERISPYVRRVFYYETDKMAIVHNSNYLRIFEEARLDYMAKAGLFYKELESRGVLIPVVSASVRYLEPLHYEDEFRVETRMTSFNGIRFSYAYRVVRTSDGALCAEGESGHCFMDEKTRVPLSLRRREKEMYDVWKSLMDEETANG
jgi:acyl-CoA thioester hydrolase